MLFSEICYLAMETDPPIGTNCVAFSIECKIPAPKRKKTAGKSRDSDR